MKVGHDVEMTADDARNLIDTIEDDFGTELVTALDNAQGAIRQGKTDEVKIVITVIKE